MCGGGGGGKVHMEWSRAASGALWNWGMGHEKCGKYVWRGWSVREVRGFRVHAEYRNHIRWGWWCCICHATFDNFINLGPFARIAITPKITLAWLHSFSLVYLPPTEQVVMGGHFTGHIAVVAEMQEGTGRGMKSMREGDGSGRTGEGKDVWFFLYVTVSLACCTYCVHHEYELLVQIHITMKRVLRTIRGIPVVIIVYKTDIKFIV